MPVKKNKSGMFPRAIDSKLKEWMDTPGRKPLILRGARQVGKTVAVNLFARHFDHFVNLLNVPYFLAAKIHEYVEWMMEQVGHATNSTTSSFPGTEQ